MRKALALLILGFVIMFFSDSMVWAAGKGKPVADIKKHKLVAEAENIRQKVLQSIVKQAEADFRLTSALNEFEGEQMISLNFLQIKSEEISEIGDAISAEKAAIEVKIFDQLSLKEIKMSIKNIKELVSEIDAITASYNDRATRYENKTRIVRERREKEEIDRMARSIMAEPK